jgi:hypothetical protein
MVEDMEKNIVQSSCVRPSVMFSILAQVVITVVIIVLSVGCGSAVARAEYASTVAEVQALPIVRPDFPTPTDQNLLFYIQHSSSPNTVVYTARIDRDGKIDPGQPIDVYWRRFANGGGRAPLSFVERMFGYGMHIDRQPEDTSAITGNIVGYPQRSITIKLDSNARPFASIEMGSRVAKLIYVYLNVDERHLIPSVSHADIFGLDLENGYVLHEVISPSSRP